MKYRKLVLSLVLFCFVVINSACSWITRFVIVNKSNAPVEIRLQYEPLSGERFLKKTALDAKGEIVDQNWQNLAPEEFQDNKPAEIVTLKLDANTALAVAEEVNYTGHNAGHADFFKIKNLEIRGAGGTVRIDGKQVLLQFEKQDDSLYTIIYK